MRAYGSRHNDEAKIRFSNFRHHEGWAYGNWIKNGYRKASEIDFPVLKLKTARGEIICCHDRSPLFARKMREMIEGFYKLSGEPMPLFINLRLFKHIERLEKGIVNG